MSHRPDDLLDPDALLRRAGSGDEDAFAAFYDQVASRVFGITLRILGSSALAEEVTQEVFVDVWRRCAGFDPARGSATGWITSVAHRRSVERVRSAGAAGRGEVPRAGLPATPSSGGGGPDPSRVSMEAAVQAALAGLTPPQRDALRLTYLDGRSCSDVARLMDAPVGTTRARVRDALTGLRVALDAPRAEPA